ncbi:translocation/assembly module TamB domain-containing protein [Brucella pecoris]|uniref:Translocation and assembly module TamB n=1 Tax=Brucella pecoris TaxID=867683 RepID=A0A5C5CPC1_9HYPH|nr:translocation/assembly module TamB domain-containing protein [Brucella pecoris]MBB4093626.1 translocation and assembly module TamB [Brucella pecoris]TNV12995.1 translocation/assembly module TamB [Brucella pecoris]
MTKFLAIIAFVAFAVTAVIFGWPEQQKQLQAQAQVPAQAQEQASGQEQAEAPAEEEKSYFLSFVESQLSAPNRRISISGISGVLSSEATVGSITIADREGVWLRIENAKLNWSRTALLVGRLSIQSLAAERIDIIRKPLPDNSLPSPESSTFSLPDLPISINLDQLAIARLHFGPDIFGLESEVSANGSLSLADGSLDSNFDIKRLDGPGGNFALRAAYANADQKVDLDLKVSEPANGIVANLLNIDGRPPVDLTLTGAGPLDELKVDLALDTNGSRTLTGEFALNRQGQAPDGGRVFSARFNGPIAVLVPPVFRDFFGAETVLSADGFLKDAGGFRLDDLALNSAALKLKASAETGNDRFLNKLRIDASIADESKGRVLLPVKGAETYIDNAKFQVAYGDRPTNDWTGTLAIAGLKNATISAQSIALDMGGVAENLDDAANRHVTFKVNGGMDGISAERAEIAEALGNKIALAIDGAWRAGSPVELSQANIAGNGLSLDLKGNIDDLAFNGDIAAKIASLAPFGALADRDLAGSIDVNAKGIIRPVSGAFQLDLNGTAQNMRTGTEAVDRILDGAVNLSGALGRSAEGFSARDFRIGNELSEITANGSFASDKASFDFGVMLSDLKLLSDQASGRMTVKGSARGDDKLIALALRADAPEGTLAGRKLSEGGLDFNAMLDGNAKAGAALSGKLAGSAFLNGQRVDLGTLIDIVNDEKRLTNLVFNAGGAHLSGNVTQTAKGLLTGALKLDAPDISTAAALALAEATGAANADITLDANDGRQNASITANAKDIKVNGNHITSADIALTAKDLFGVPVVDGNAAARDIMVGTFGIDSFDAKANATGSKTDFTANTKLKIGTVASAAGSLEPKDGGFELGLASANVKQGTLSANLAAPATISMKGEEISFGDIIINTGADASAGQVKVNGVIDGHLDLSVALSNLPLALANTFKPELGLGGTVNGTARITGTKEAPDVAFDMAAQGVTAAELKKQGIAPLNADAKGTSANNRLNVDAHVTGGGGIDVRANGGVPLGKGDLAVDVNLANLPLTALNGAVKGQDLAGNVTGTARVTGPLTNPAATFNLRGTGLAAKPLRDNGLAPLTLQAAGSYAAMAIDFSSLTVDGPRGLNVSANGKVPFSGQGLGVNVNGSIPLALANRFLADRGAQANGTLTLTASVSGGFNRPQLRGMFSTNGATFVDPDTNVRLNNINVMGSLDGETITLRQVNAALGSGGSVSASGTISTNAEANFPANIEIKLNRARYADGKLVVATVDGGITISGPLMRDPLISGRIDVDRAEISVPENLGGGAAYVPVRHKNTPKNVQITLDRAKVETRRSRVPTPTARPTVPRLDVLINAPNQIFVRGRGLDTELGGRLRLTGPVTDIKPVGSFDMIRGRIGILGQRITFDEGHVTLVGDLNPQLNFVARSEGNEITAIVTVTGTVDNLDIQFSSTPELPQDEVLAQLIFKRSIGELSAFQIAQLAAAAAELAGGSNNSLMNKLRAGTGLDDLDVVTDDKGQTAVRAGRYIRDNIYLGVEAGSGGSTKGTVNLDITRNLKAKGALGAEGDSSGGIFYEKDY